MKTPTPPRRRTMLNMIPMIDVIFLLLIFFICTANFQRPEQLLATDLSLTGDTVKSPVIKPKNIDVAVIKIIYDPKAVYTVTENRCETIGQLRSVLNSLSELKQDLPVIITPDDNVPMEIVIQVYDTCREAGLTKIQFAA
ncbi:MAG: biopolymer transporter ExbD, partial [Planctomycetaceae bacterium]|nr:biopolymer transporter ExbD [Planctomycetaceae bacterium]